MRTVRYLLLTVPIAIVLAGCGGEASGGDNQTVTIKFRLADYDTAFYDCEGTGGYSDIGTGTSVVIRDGDGDVLGAGKLGQGKPSSNGIQATFCDWTVEIPNVPTGLDFYVAEVGGRGETTSSEADLAADGWQFDISLGEAD